MLDICLSHLVGLMFGMHAFIIIIHSGDIRTPFHFRIVNFQIYSGTELFLGARFGRVK